MSIEIWEQRFKEILQVRKHNKAGALLSAVPTHEDWDKFLEIVKKNWNKWKVDLENYPGSLVMLFCGLAFYEYDENTFWPKFADAIGCDELLSSQQNDIKQNFLIAIKQLGLEVPAMKQRTSYVGLAIYFIGIPLSLWDDFLEICEWALLQNHWKDMSDEEWVDAIGRRVGGRKRLKRFLIDYRSTANSLIKEMIEAREILSKEINLTLKDIAQASILRSEYFDEVPETAEFLRPQNPDSLFQDRAKLVWNDNRSTISIHLPPVDQDKLPAIWELNTFTQDAAANSDEMILNSLAFSDYLHLSLKVDKYSETQRFKGLKPWGLFDLSRGGRLINSNRDELPLGYYVIISEQRIDEIIRDGFDEQENPVNEPFELKDKKICFITRLYPNAKYAELILKDKTQTFKIKFRPKARLEARFFAGEGNRAANFMRLDEDKVKIEHLPILCVSVPCGFFKDNKKELNSQFKVHVDSQPALGEWEHLATYEDDKEIYSWKWIGPPSIERIESKTGRLKDLTYHASDLRGERIFSIESPTFFIRYKTFLEHSIYKMHPCWKDLPGDYFLLFLLCQSNNGMKWDDLMFAKDVIIPGFKRNFYELLRRYSEQGFIVQRGRSWEIVESRATLNSTAGNNFQLEYCGDPTILWGLYRCICQIKKNYDPPIIEVINKKGSLPYLKMIWPYELRNEIKNYLLRKGIKLGYQLWTH